MMTSGSVIGAAFLQFKLANISSTGFTLELCSQSHHSRLDSKCCQSRTGDTSLSACLCFGKVAIVPTEGDSLPVWLADKNDSHET